MKITFDIPSFAFGTVITAILVSVSPLRLPPPFAVGGVALATIAGMLVISFAGVAAQWFVNLRPRPPTIERLKPPAQPLNLPHAPPLPMSKWLASLSLEPSKISSLNETAVMEKKIAAELGDQMNRCDSALADSLAILFLYLGSYYRDNQDAVIARAASIAWKAISEGRRVDLAEVIAGLRGSDAFAKTERRHAELSVKHAYAVTRMISTMSKYGGARTLLPSDFLWLHDIDPVLWYAVNNVGRKTFFVEALGPMAHYLAEKQATVALPKPAVTAAATAVVNSLIASGEIRIESPAT